MKLRNLLLNAVLFILSIILFILSYNYSNFFLFLIGALTIVINVLALIVMMTLDLYRKDQEFNVEELKKQGLTIVTCQECNEVNVLEDKYCRKCQEPLTDV